MNRELLFRIQKLLLKNSEKTPQKSNRKIKKKIKQKICRKVYLNW